jgi:hypothetical protein
MSGNKLKRLFGKRVSPRLKELKFDFHFSTSAKSLIDG